MEVNNPQNYQIDDPSFDFMMGLKRIRQDALPIQTVVGAKEFLFDLRNQLTDFILTFYRGGYMEQNIQPDPTVGQFITNANELIKKDMVQNDPHEFSDEKIVRIAKKFWSQSRTALSQRGLVPSDVDVPPIILSDRQERAERLFSLPVDGIPHDHEFAHSDLNTIHLYFNQEHQLGIINAPDFSPVGGEIAPEKHGKAYFQRRRAEITRLFDPLMDRDGSQVSMNTIHRGDNDVYLLLHPFNENSISQLYSSDLNIMDHANIQLHELNHLDKRLLMTMSLFRTDSLQDFYSPETVQPDQPQDDTDSYIEIQTIPASIPPNIADDLAGKNTRQTGLEGGIIVAREMAAKYGPDDENQFEILAKRLGLDEKLESFYARQIRRLTTTNPPRSPVNGPNITPN